MRAVKLCTNKILQLTQVGLVVNCFWTRFFLVMVIVRVTEWSLFLTTCDCSSNCLCRDFCDYSRYLQIFAFILVNALWQHYTCKVYCSYLRNFTEFSVLYIQYLHYWHRLVCSHKFWTCDYDSDDIIQMMHGSECDVEIWWTRGWKCRMRVQPECDIFNRGSSYLNVARTTVLHMFRRSAKH